MHATPPLHGERIIGDGKDLGNAVIAVGELPTSGSLMLYVGNRCHMEGTSLMLYAWSSATSLRPNFLWFAVLLDDLRISPTLE